MCIRDRRVLDGRSPFKPDRMHLHHRLIDSGLDVKRTVAIMVGFHTVLMFVGILISFTMPQWSDLILFWGFVLVVLLQASQHPTADVAKFLRIFRRRGSRTV